MAGILSIIIPVFNEEKTVSAAVEKILNQDLGGWGREVIVVDDGSRDKTRQKLEPFFGKIKFMAHEKNLGKGAAIKTALKEATGNAIIVHDADSEYDTADLPRLLNELHDDKTAIYGSRNMGCNRRGYFFCAFGVKMLTVLTNLLFGLRLTDVYSCYKLFPASMLKSLRLKSDGFEIDAEITVKILKHNFGIREIPINYNPRKYSEGKKIKFKDGIIALWTIVRYYFY